MPDASKHDTFIVADVDVHDGDLVVIDGPGEWVDFEDKQSRETRTRLRIPIVCPGGVLKEITLNETSRKKLVEGYDKHTEAWVGKKALVNVVTKDVFGQMKKVVYLSPVHG